MSQVADTSRSPGRDTNAKTRYVFVDFRGTLIEQTNLPSVGFLVGPAANLSQGGATGLLIYTHFGEINN